MYPIPLKNTIHKRKCVLTDREINGQIDPNQNTKYSVNVWDTINFNIVVTKWYYNEVPSQLLLK